MKANGVNESYSWKRTLSAALGMVFLYLKAETARWTRLIKEVNIPSAH